MYRFRKAGLVVALLGVSFLPLMGQTDNTFYAKQFPGNDVGTKVTEAQAQCNPNLNCLIVIDSSLASYQPGSMPAQCASCTWLDYRTPGVFPANSVQAYNIDGVYKVDGSHYTTIQQAINTCLSNAAAYLNSNDPRSGGNQPMCFVDASVAPSVASRTFGGYDPEVYCPNGPGAGSCQAFCSQGSGLAGCYQSKAPGSMCAPSSPATCTTIPLKVTFPASTYANPIIETDTFVWESGSDYEGVATANTGGVSAGTVIEALGGGTATTSGGDPLAVINQNPLMQANNTNMENISWIANPNNFSGGAIVATQNGFQATCDNAAGSEPFNGSTPGNAQGLTEMTWKNVWVGGPGTGYAFTGSGIDLDCEQLSVNAGLEQITFDHVTSYRENTSTAAALNIVGDVALVTFTEGMYKPVTNTDMTAATVFIGTYSGGTQVPYNISFDKSVLFLGGPLVFQLAGASTLKIGTIHVESAGGGVTSFMTCGQAGLNGITSGVVVDGAQFQGVATGAGTWLFNWNLCQGVVSPRTLLVTHSVWAASVANVYEATPATNGNWPFAVFRDNQPQGASSPTSGLVPTLVVSGATQAIAAYNLPLINLSASAATTVTSITSSLTSGETLTLRNISASAVVSFTPGSAFDTGGSLTIPLAPKQSATWMVNDGTGGALLGLVSASAGAVPIGSVSGTCTGTVGTAGPYVMPFLGGGSTSGACSMAPSSYVGLSYPVAVTLSNLTVRCDTSGLSASSGVFSVVTQAAGRNSFSAPTGTLTLTFGTSAANSILQDTTHTVSLNPGDLWQLDFTSAGAGETLSYCSASVEVTY